MDLAPPPAPDLLLDLLSVPAGRALEVKTLCRAGQILGLPDNAVRVALTRMVQQRKIAKVGRGTYALHPSRMAVMQDVADWSARLDQMRDWSGGWVGLVDPELPAARRTELNRHRRALTLRGFRMWKPGFNLRPDNLKDDADTLLQRLTDLGLAEGTELVRLHRVSDRQCADIVALWDVDQLRERYTQLTGELERSAARFGTLSVAEAARESLLLGRAAIAQLARDPLLPDALMQGRERNALVETVIRYQADSKRIWNQALDLPQQD